jgi:integrase/recombinase XerC
MFTERFIRYIQYEKRYSPHTVSAYQSDLDQFISFLNNPEKQTPAPDPVITHPSQITHHDIRNWMVHLMNDHILARSVNRKIATLRKYFKFLLQEGEITINPSSKINTPKVPKNLPVIVEDIKLIQMLTDSKDFGTDFKGVRDKLVVEMLFGTGMRLSELLGVKDTDISVYEGTVKVLGKRNKERIIPINKELIYLIVQKYLSYISTQNKKSPHVLRHTFATSLLNRGADLNAIKELLGHANLSATQVYTHNSVERLKSIYKQAHPKA